MAFMKAVAVCAVLSFVFVANCEGEFCYSGLDCLFGEVNLACSNASWPTQCTNHECVCNHASKTGQSCSTTSDCGIYDSNCPTLLSMHCIDTKCHCAKA